MANKSITADAAAALVCDGDAATTWGFAGIGVPGRLLRALAERFSETSAQKGKVHARSKNAHIFETEKAARDSAT